MAEAVLVEVQQAMHTRTLRGRPGKDDELAERGAHGARMRKGGMAAAPLTEKDIKAPRTPLSPSKALSRGAVYPESWGVHPSRPPPYVLPLAPESLPLPC